MYEKNERKRQCQCRIKRLYAYKKRERERKTRARLLKNNSKALSKRSDVLRSRTFVFTESLLSTVTTPGLNFATTGTCPGKIPKSPVSAGTKTIFTRSFSRTALCGKRKFNKQSSWGLSPFEGCASSSETSVLFCAIENDDGVFGSSIIDGLNLENCSWNFCTDVRELECSFERVISE